VAVGLELVGAGALFPVLFVGVDVVLGLLDDEVQSSVAVEIGDAHLLDRGVLFVEGEADVGRGPGRGNGLHLGRCRLLVAAGGANGVVDAVSARGRGVHEVGGRADRLGIDLGRLDALDAAEEVEGHVGGIALEQAPADVDRVRAGAHGHEAPVELLADPLLGETRDLLAALRFCGRLFGLLRCGRGDEESDGQEEARCAHGGSSGLPNCLVQYNGALAQRNRGGDQHKSGGQSP